MEQVEGGENNPGTRVSPLLGYTARPGNTKIYVCICM